MTLKKNKKINTVLNLKIVWDVKLKLSMFKLKLLKF